MPGWYRCSDDLITLNVHVQPNARRNAVDGLHGEALKIRLAAPPLEGRANAALRKFVAQLFSVPLQQVELKKGVQSRYKVLTISGSDIHPEMLVDRL